MENDNFEIANHSKREITIDIGMANVMAIIIAMPFILILAIPFFIIWGKEFVNPFENVDYGVKFGVIMFAMLVGIVVHEIIHGLTWSLFLKKGFKSIKFGVFWKMLTPYCHSKEPLTVWQYIVGSIMPGVLLGILPSLAAWFNGNVFQLIFGLIFTLAAGGDFAIIWLLRKEKMEKQVMDHPSKVGCFVYDPLSN